MVALQQLLRGRGLCLLASPTRHIKTSSSLGALALPASRNGCKLAKQTDDIIDGFRSASVSASHLQDNRERLPYTVRGKLQDSNPVSRDLARAYVDMHNAAQPGELGDLERNKVRITLARAISAGKIEILRSKIHDKLQESGAKLLHTLQKAPLASSGLSRFARAGEKGMDHCEDSLDANFFRRLTAVWTCLFNSARPSASTNTLTAIANEAWLSRIMHSIPTEVKALLVEERCPTWDELIALPKVETLGTETCNAGVYAWLTETRYVSNTASDRLVCVGGAKADPGGGGMIGSVNRHQTAEATYFAPRPQTQFEKKTGPWSANFIPLMDIKIPSRAPQNPAYLSTMVDITQVILAVWLGGSKARSLRLGNAFPSDYHKTDYKVVVP